jgi:hypothetical protein
LKKAFDSVVHLLLLRKLKEIFDIPNNMLIVIGNYLFIRIGKAMSKGFLVNRGIGQGLVFGLNLFVLFINDVGKILADCSYTLFADDLAIYVSSKNVVQAVSKISDILCRFDNWCSVNGLSVNYAKTKYMVIRKPQTKIPIVPKVFVREKELEYVSSFKYLGVHLDELFSFRDHFQHVSGQSLQSFWCNTEVKKICIAAGIQYTGKCIYFFSNRLLFNSLGSIKSEGT